MTRILLVEPDDGAATALRASLGQHSGWEVTRVASVLEAIRTAGETKFDAAILDYDLPDGTGLDLLDFLRIGSPGIRIVMLSDQRSEEIAFHALSHGAGEVLVKDKHLEAELPRRVEGLLEHIDATAALVETLLPSTYEDRRFQPAPPQEETQSALQTALHELVTGNVVAAGVWDHLGKPVALRLMPDLDPAGLGFALATIHGQVGGIWTYGNLKPTGYVQLVDVDGGILGITAIPGTFLVAMLFELPIHKHRAMEKLEQAAHRLTQASQA